MSRARDVYGKMSLLELRQMREGFEADFEEARDDQSREFIEGRLNIVNWFIVERLSGK